jgi:hypothetical protein
MSIESEIRSLLQEGGISFDTTARSLVLTCPKCNKSEKLYIRRSDGRFVCWVCKETERFDGKPEYALKEILNKSLSEIKTRLYGKAEPAFTQSLSISFDSEEEFEEELPLPEVAYPLHYTDPYGPAISYLESRGIPLNLVQEYVLRYDPKTKRVIFPILRGPQLIGWQGRSIQSEAERTYIDYSGKSRIIPKIMSNDELSGVRDRVLMFEDRLTNCDHAVLGEGPVDALKAHLCGGNVCSMGKEVSRFQIDLILKKGIRKLYLGLDPDAADSIARLVRDYCSDLECYQMDIPPKINGKKNDMGEMSFEGVYDLFKSAKRVNSADIFIFLP